MSKSALFIPRALSVFCGVLILFSTMPTEFTVDAASKISPPKTITVSFISTGVRIKWSKVKSAKGYYIYRKKSTSTKFTRIAKITKNSKLTYTDNNAQSGNYYIYAVKAYMGDNTSSYKKSTKKFYVKAPVLSSLTNNYSSITVKWKKVKGVTGYYLYRKTGNGNWKKIATLKGDSKVKYTDKKVTDGKKYTYSLKAYKSGKTSVRGTTKQLKFKKTAIKVSLNKTNLTLFYGKTYNLIATPSIKDVSVKWKSSNKNIASVNSKGKIKAVAEGTAEITAYFIYNEKQYKKTCYVTVKEKEYGIGDTVNLDGKLTFKIESVRAHSSCKSTLAAYGSDKLIISYSYKNICCGNNLKIDGDKFSLSDAKGKVGSFAEDCMYCIFPDACSDGVTESGAVAVGVLKSKGDYCYLRLTVNVSDYGKVTAKFKLKIDRSDEVFLGDENVLSVMGAAVNAVKMKLSNKTGFKLIDAVYQSDNSFVIGAEKVKASTCTLKYEYISPGGQSLIKCVKAWYDDKIYHHTNCKYYYVNGRILVVMEQSVLPTSYDGKIQCESVLLASNIYKVTEFIQ